MSTQTPPDSSESTTRGIPHVPPPKPPKATITGHDRRATPPPPKPSKHRSTSDATRNLIIGGAIIIATLIILLLAGVSTRTKTINHTTTVTKTVPARTLVLPNETGFTTLAGIDGIAAKVGISAMTGATIRLSIRSVSHYSYAAYLITPPVKTEELFSSREGRNLFTHKLTLEHLLGYRYLRIYIYIPGKQPKPALQVATSTVAEPIIEHEQEG